MQSLLEQVSGIRPPADSRTILTALARGEREVQDVASRTGLEAPSVRRALKVLMGLSIVRAERNFGAPPKAPFRYRIADNAVAFWHRYLVAHRSMLAMEDPRHLWSLLVAPSLDTMMGHVFEHIVEQAFARFHQAWGLPAARVWSRWEGADRQRENVEIDVVGRLDDDRLLVGEVKWSAAPRGPGLHTGLLEKLARLAASGQGWANATNTATFLYVSASGFTDAMKVIAASDARIRLLALDDLYRD
jgi:AAA+ ATPase superfamily predicted ATPase